VDGVLRGIVCHGVLEHKADVVGNLVARPVGDTMELHLDCSKIHWLLDYGKVIWETERNRIDWAIEDALPIVRQVSHQTR
jgi:hypothetical protein